MRRRATHFLRVLVFVAIVLLIRTQHRAFLASRPAVVDVSLPTIRHFFPTAVTTRASPDIAAATDVLDGANEHLGSVIQTSPDSDPLIGFSGPSNLLIAFDKNGRIVGVEILSSRDTVEHVQDVKDDPKFLGRFNGLSWDEAANIKEVDAVSGSTLTSLAMIEGVQRRLGGKPASLKFTAQVTLPDVKPLFPAATRIEPDPGEPAVLRVYGPAPLGWVLRTSPAADNIIGYQGPTDALIGFDPQGRVVGLAVRKSYDNEPYVGYVRKDDYFLTLFNGKSLEELAGLDLKAAEVEGVAGATMTSMAVAKGLVLAAQQKRAKDRQPVPLPLAWWERLPLADIGTIAVVLAGTLIGLTNLRGIGWVRVLFQIGVFAYLGLVNAALLSQAQLAGWAQAGMPRGAWGLVFLSAAAFLLPLTTKKNVYCSHLCPHGALQQLALRYARPRWKIPHWVRTVLLLIPALLLVWTLVIALAHWPFSLVDIEPFDAYVFRVAGWATLTIAVVGIALSLFVPMAYCRYGCPTGALLEYLRYNARSARLCRRDALAIACLGAALFWWLISA